MKVVGYARTSWAEQVQETFSSVEKQEEELRRFAEKAGVRMVKVHTDVGLRPGHGTCAGMINILDSMVDGWEAVIVVSPCRLENIPTLSFDALEELRGQGRQVLVATDKAAKELAKRRPREAPRPVKAEECEGKRRREIAARLFRGREAGAKAGKHQSGPAPYGYRRDYSRRTTDGVLLVPDSEEADVVKMIFREYLRLRSMKRLIKLLDDKGLRTRRGKQWSRAGVSWILKNDTYVGRVHFGEIHVKGRHDAIVPPILFNKVQKLIRANNKRNRKQIQAEDAGKAKAKAKARKPAKAAPAQTAPAPAAKSERPALSTTARRRRREHAASGSGAH